MSTTNSPALAFAQWLQSIGVQVIGEDVDIDRLYDKWQKCVAAPAQPMRYQLQYRDASGFDWQPLAEFPTPGGALTIRDQELADGPEWLPKGRHRVVDMETGAILNWRHESVER